MNLLPGRLTQPIAQTLESLSTTSKTLFAVLAFCMATSAFIIIKDINNRFLVEVPGRGGVLKEGIVGTPRLINPVLAQNDSGKDIIALVYAGLVRKTADGIKPELASEYHISNDGLVYTFTLKTNITFHDGIALTSRDVAYTIRTIQNTLFHSPKRINFDQIKVETPDDATIVFTLPRPSNSFLNNMTIGILPEHLWKSVKPDEFAAIEYNSEPIGAGPYMIDSVDRGKGGLALAYNLVPFKKYVGATARLDSIQLIVYQNDSDAYKALLNNNISSVGGILPEEAKDLLDKGYTVEKHSLPRMFGLFINQSQNTLLADVTLRKILNNTAPRQEIADTIFNGYAIPIDSPFDRFGISSSTALSLENASTSLDKAGWKMGENGFRAKKNGKDSIELAFSIATSDADDLKKTAYALQETWKKLGINVSVNIYESGELNQTIIRERKYDTLLFGEVITQDSDYIAFWHSSQRKDPGLNVALYANAKVDNLLSNLKNSTSTVNYDILRTLDSEFSKDMPAIMLYSPVYIHVVPSYLSGTYTGPLKETSDRFIDITDWYTRKEKVWPIFAKLNQ